jgi:hypothetical protein
MGVISLVSATLSLVKEIILKRKKKVWVRCNAFVFRMQLASLTHWLNVEQNIL